MNRFHRALIHFCILYPLYFWRVSADKIIEHCLKTQDLIAQRIEKSKSE
jgi:hypothetical protein